MPALLAQSHGPWYDVETGRRDGNVTVAEYVENDLPLPDSNIVDVKTFFSVKSSSVAAAVLLRGAGGQMVPAGPAGRDRGVDGGGEQDVRVRAGAGQRGRAGSVGAGLKKEDAILPVDACGR